MDFEDFEPRSQKSKKGVDLKGDMSLRLSRPGYVKSTTSNAPQVIVKITGNPPRGAGVRDAMRYIARVTDEHPLVLENQDGELIQGADEISSEYDKWKGEFEEEPEWKIEANNKYEEWKKKNPDKDTTEYTEKIPRMKRHTTHMILSGKVENTDHDTAKLLASARELMQKEFADKGYEYTMVMHRDSDNPHVHVLINNYGREIETPKLRINKPELFMIRQEFADRLQEKGIEAAATLVKDRPNTLERVQKGLQRVHQSETHFKRQMEKASGSSDAFKHRQSQFRQLKYIENIVRDEISVFSGFRSDYIREIKELTRAMKTEDKQNLDIKIEKTVNKLTNDSKEFGDHLDKLKNPDIKTELSPLEKLSRRRAITKYAENIQKDVSTAIETIKKSHNIEPALKKESLKILKARDKQLQKVKGREL